MLPSLKLLLSPLDERTVLTDFQNRVAVVTGAASGIGKALAAAFLDEGARVVLSDVNEEELKETAEEFRNSGFDVLDVVTDVSKSADLERLAVKSFHHFGQVDILCNNAGVSHPGGATWDISLEDWQWILGINLMGAVHGIKSFLPRMIKQQTPGIVLNTSSILGMQLGTTNAAYPITKHGIVVLSECICNELRRQRKPISVHVLCPGFVSTQILDSMAKCPSASEPKEDEERSEQALTYDEWFEREQNRGLDPAEVAELAFEGIRDGKFYIFAPKKMKQLVEVRMRAILDDAQPSDEDYIKEHARELGFDPPPPRPDEVVD